MTINHPDERVWPTTYWAYSDLKIHRRHQKYRETYQGTILNPNTIAPWATPSDRAKTTYFHRRPGPGFSRDLNKGYHLGLSTTYAAMQLALWMDYQQTYLLGVDMDPGNPSWFYGDNPDAEASNKAKRFAREAEHYDHAARVLSEAERSRFTFCSDSNPWPFKTQFQTCPQADAIDQILAGVS